MASLTRHLLAGAEHDGYALLPECPRCAALCAGPPLPDGFVPGRAAISTLLAATAFGTFAAPATTIASPGVSVKPITTEKPGTPEPTDGPAEPDDPDVDNSDEPTAPGVTDGTPTPEVPAPVAPPRPPPVVVPAPVAPPAPPTTIPPPDAPVAEPPVPPAPPVAAPAPEVAPTPPPPPATEGQTVDPTPPVNKPPKDRVRHPAPTSASSAPVRERGHHVVAAGECLWSIARARLGANASTAAIARYVDALWEANARQLGTHDPDVIPVGADIVLPSTSVARSTQ